MLTMILSRWRGELGAGREFVGSRQNCVDPTQVVLQYGRHDGVEEWRAAVDVVMVLFYVKGWLTGQEVFELFNFRNEAMA